MMKERMAIPRNPPPPAAHIAVVTVSYGSESVLVHFLSSLPGATSMPLSVVVADNKPSSDSSAVREISESAGAKYHPTKSNRGYGNAVNEVVKDLPVEIQWVLISNPDVTASPGSIDVLLETLTEDPKIAAVGPRILSSDGMVYPSARRIPSIRTGVGHALFANLWPTNPWTRRYRRDANSDLAQRDAGWLSGAFLMVRRSVFDELKGFDETYFMYFEDVDLGYRIGKLGLRNVYVPAATVVHTGAHSTQGGESARMVRAHHDSAKRFLFRKYPGRVLWPVRMVLGAGLEIRARLEESRAPH